MSEWIAQFLATHGFSILCLGTVFFLLACGIGLPVPEEIIFLSAGFAASAIGLTREQLAVLCLLGVIGILAGDSLPFMLGRHYGMSLLSRPRFAKLLTPPRVAKVQDYFRVWGAWTVFGARFLAGLRIPTFFMAATMGVRYRTFFFCDLLGALISCPTSILLAWYFGPHAREILERGKVYIFIALGVLAALSIYRWYRCGPPPLPPTNVKPPGNLSSLNPPEKKSDTGHAEVRR